MESKFAPNALLILFMFPFNLALLFSIAMIAATRAHPPRIALKLIHRDSAFDPSYSRNAIDINPIEEEADKSLARLAYLKAKAKGNNSSSLTEDIRGPVIAGNNFGGFLVNFSVGNPPVPQLAIMDTGSDLIWFRCLPCTRCSKQSSPVFDPQKSSTYMPVPCDDSKYCTSLFPAEGKCDPSKHCKFEIKYVGGDDVKGLRAIETLTFETSDDGVVQVPNVVIGCGHDNYDPIPDGQKSGVMGLGLASYSLTYKLGEVFSYCIGSISDPTYAYNQLIIGEGAIIEGDSTPIEVSGGGYYLTMEGISINSKMFAIDHRVFVDTGGFIIDSGATFSILPPLAYNALSSGVSNLINGKLEQVHTKMRPDLLCYKGDRDRDLVGFPVVRFHFADGAELAMDSRSLFTKSFSGVFCMAVQLATSPLEGIGMIGIMAQQGYNVAYDLKADKIYFQDIDCQLLV